MSLLSWLTRRRPLDLDEEDFKAEIRAHLEIAATEKAADGVDEQTARYAALREFGSVTLATEATRRVWTPRWLESLRDLMSDVRYATRALAKNRAFSLTVIGVLALGIGLNAAVFTMVKSLALTPLSGVNRSAQLAVVYRETTAGRALRLSYPDYLAIRDHTQAFSGLFGSSAAQFGFSKDRNSRSLRGEMVTGNYFQTLGVRAQVGRTLLPSDDVATGAHPVVVISDGLWRREFGGDPNVAGQVVEINNQPLTIVGVADASFHGTIVSYDVEVFVPVMMAPQLGFTFGSQATAPAEILADRQTAVFVAQGFLRSGTTLTTTASELEALWSTLAPGRPHAASGERLRVVPFRQSPGTGPTYMLPTLLMLSSMGLLVLLIACANIAGLVLVRGASRRGEIAMRLALGATRARIVRLLVIENVVLAVPGAVLGVVLASRGVPMLLAYADWLAAPDRIFLNIGVDAFVVAFAVVIACGCALAFGFVPALRSSRVNLMAVTNEVSMRGTVRGRFRSALVVAQVAVSVLLLVGAGLVTRSVQAARAADPGFAVSHVTSIDLDVKQNGYDASRGRVFYRQLLDAALAANGTESATLAAHNPLNFLETRAQRVAVEHYEPAPTEDLSFLSNVVAPGYFETLRIGLLTGRAFDERDDETAESVVIVNRTFAERFWGEATNAIGKRIQIADPSTSLGTGSSAVAGPETTWRTVIGVAADVKYLRVNESPRPYVYLPFLQAYRPIMTLHTRGTAPVDILVAQARHIISHLDADLPILSARPLSERIAGSFILLDFAAAMLFVFGAAGMILAALGTYGLVSYSVKQSTHEIGIRLALGASALSVVRVFLGRGLRLGAIGAAVGVLAALAIGGALRSVLFGVVATDATSFAIALSVVLGGVLLAALVPAWRAARTNPLNALRH